MASCKKDHKIPILTRIPWILVSLTFLFRVLSPSSISPRYYCRFYFPGILVGPHLDFAEYMELINETKFQDTTQVKAKVEPGRRLPLGRKRAAFTKLFFGLVYLGAFVLYGGKYNYQVALKPEFMKHSLLMRYVNYFSCVSKVVIDQFCF